MTERHRGPTRTGRPPIGHRAMTGAERQRLYIARREAKAAAAALASKPAPTPTPLVAPAAASAPPPPLPTPRLAESLEPERAGIRDCERLIESGWSFDRIERYFAAGAKTLVRHREATEAEPKES